MYPRFENEAWSNSELARIFGHGKCFLLSMFLRSLGVLVQNRPTYFKSFHLKLMKSHTSANELGAHKNIYIFKCTKMLLRGVFGTLLLEIGSQQI